MSLPKRVVLVGPMGAGKSTIGRMLARELGYRFMDSDRIIEERCGADIPWIFDVEGEEGFRDRETAILSELSSQPQTVLATGGGAVMREENHPHLKRDALGARWQLPHHQGQPYDSAAARRGVRRSRPSIRCALRASGRSRGR